jgi:hypothetical protein
MTQKPSRLRRWLKWAGLVVCLAIAGLWAASGMIRFGVAVRRGSLSLFRGTCNLLVAYGDPSSAQPGPLVTIRPHFMMKKVDRLRWHAGWPSIRSSGRTRNFALWLVTLPLWLPFGVVALPAAYLWYRDRRPPRGRCRRCGYDLTGNVSGRCPECGDTL